MKLIFIDIDGTLTIPGENAPPDSALAAIRASQAKGNKVFLCTGRNPDMLKPLLVYNFDGYVGCGGGYVVAEDEVLFDCPMTDEQREIALRTLHDSGVFCTVEAKDGSWGDENLGIRPMQEYDNRPIYKVVMMCTSLDQLDACKAELEKDFQFVFQEVKAYSCMNGELVNRKFDKGLGVRLIAEHYGVPISDTYGFGDSINDLEMIETVGTSVCMENGADALKAVSDIICPSVQEDGLAKAFSDLGLD